LLLKAKKFLEEKGIKPEKILPDIFVPLLNKGGNVEDETLQDMFASLLASHLDPSKQDKVHPSFSKVLAQLSSLDATLLLEFRKGEVGRMQPLPKYAHFSDPSDLATLLCVPFLEVFLSCLNLERLGFIYRRDFNRTKGFIPYVARANSEYNQFRISQYGIQFCDACHYQPEEKE
jgi:hypothetical protein